MAMNTQEHREGETLDLKKGCRPKLTRLAVMRASAKAAMLEQSLSGVAPRLRAAATELSVKCLMRAVLSSQGRRRWGEEVVCDG